VLVDSDGIILASGDIGICFSRDKANVKEIDPVRQTFEGQLFRLFDKAGFFNVFESPDSGRFRWDRGSERANLPP